MGWHPAWHPGRAAVACFAGRGRRSKSAVKARQAERRCRVAGRPLPRTARDDTAAGLARIVGSTAPEAAARKPGPAVFDLQTACDAEFNVSCLFQKAGGHVHALLRKKAPLMPTWEKKNGTASIWLLAGISAALVMHLARHATGIRRRVIEEMLDNAITEESGVAMVERGGRDNSVERFVFQLV